MEKMKKYRKCPALLFNPSVPNARNTERKNLLFPLQMKSSQSELADFFLASGLTRQSRKLNIVVDNELRHWGVK